MAAEGSGPSAGEYITLHLQHLQKDFSFNSVKQKDIVDFSLFNFDSLFFSTVLGLLAVFLLWRGARAATSGVPGRWQAAVEMLYELVDNQAKSVIHNEQSRRVVGPIALVAFVWIFLMNAMDMLPVDFLPQIWHTAGPALGFKDYMRVVPTADLSTTLGLAVSILLLSLYYSVKIKGAGGWGHELVSAPFGSSKNPLFAVILGLINVTMQIIEYVAKAVSHGLRLFGNMYAGELVFLLIALMGGAAAMSLPGVLLPVGHVIAGSLWAIFHILVITLQAFIFMMLALIYLGQAHEAH